MDLVSLNKVYKVEDLHQRFASVYQLAHFIQQKLQLLTIVQLYQTF